MTLKELSSEVKADLRNYFENRDYMVIAVPKKEPVRVYTLRATSAVETARRIHALSPGATVAMGRAMVAALLLTSLVKHASEQKVLLKIEGDGPIGSINVEADGKGRVRGFVSNPQVETYVKEVNGKKKIDVSKIVGSKGTLSVVKELRLGTPYMSVVPLVSGEIGEDLAYYYFQSEQIPVAVSVGVLVDKDGTVLHAGGLLVETMKGTSREAVDKLEERMFNLKPITDMMQEGKRPENITSEILDGLSPMLVGLKEIEYFCPCTEEIALRSFKSLPKEEVRELLSEGKVELTCKFCGRVYKFSEELLE